MLLTWLFLLFLGEGVSHRRIGEVLFDLCKSQDELGKFQEALSHQKQHLQLAMKANSILEQQRAYATIGRTYLDITDRTFNKVELEKAIKAASDNFLQSLQKCKELSPGTVSQDELAQMRCRLYLNLGLVAELKADLTGARDLMTKAANFARQNSLHDDLYRCHLALTSIYVKQKKYALALEEAKLAEISSRKLDNVERSESQKRLARMFLITRDYKQSKSSLVASYKALIADKRDGSELKKMVKATDELCKLSKINVELLLGDEIAKHYEKMADLFSHLKCTDGAIEYYQKLVNYAQNNKTQVDVGIIYYSMAKTFEEDNQFMNARKYYELEYNLRLDDPKEACRSMLAIAKVAESMHDSIDQLVELYDTAQNLAVMARDPKLEFHVLKMLSCFEQLPNDKKDIVQSKMQCLQIENGLNDDFELSDEEESSDPESDESIESEEELSTETKSKSNIVTAKMFGKVNLLGESLLHRACINNDLRKVKELVKKGHPINVPDTAGWLPLHEACNYGHLEVVKFLLSVGAKSRINDRGGRECEGITPMHDAAENGHLDIARLLLSNGASVIMKSDRGETPLDCLVRFRNRTTDLTDEIEGNVLSLEEELKQRMEKAGCAVPSTLVEKPARQSIQKPARQALNDTCFDDIYFSSRGAVKIDQSITHVDSSSDDELPTLNTPCSSVPKNAVVNYKSAISRLGSAASRHVPSHSTATSVCSQNMTKAGLIPEDEIICDKNFIENDMPSTSRKRKRPLSKSVLEFTNYRKERKLTNMKTNKITCSRRITHQSKLTDVFDSYASPNSNNVEIDYNNLDLENIIAIEDTCSHTDACTSGASVEIPVTNAFLAPALVSNIGSSAFASAASVSDPLRVRVRVEDEILLVPIAEASRGFSIEWLCREVSQRYYSHSGIKAEISLRTIDGAILHHADPITHVLGKVIKT